MRGLEGRLIAAAERRACSAIRRSGAGSAPAKSARTSTRYRPRKKRAQRLAVCQLPLLSRAAAGLTIRMRLRSIGWQKK
jgi:hypothetical protein